MPPAWLTALAWAALAVAFASAAWIAYDIWAAWLGRFDLDLTRIS